MFEINNFKISINKHYGTVRFAINNNAILNCKFVNTHYLILSYIIIS